jgi:hypothetical protein
MCGRTHRFSRFKDVSVTIEDICTFLNQTVLSCEGSEMNVPVEASNHFEGCVPQVDDKNGESELRDVEASKNVSDSIEVVNSMNTSEEKKTEKQNRRKALLPFAIISISYLLYTMTDGSVRMIVLLYAYNKSFTAMEVLLKTRLFSFFQRGY